MNFVAQWKAHFIQLQTHEHNIQMIKLYISHTLHVPLKSVCRSARNFMGEVFFSGAFGKKLFMTFHES